MTPFQLLDQAEKLIPSNEELTQQRKRWFSQSVWQCPDHSYRTNQECFQDWIAHRFTGIALAIGAAREKMKTEVSID